MISSTVASGFAPTGQDTTSTADVFARFTLTDLIFTGPSSTVTTTLNMAWSGFMSSSVASFNTDTYTNSNTILTINGSIFNTSTSANYLSFSGNRIVSIEQDGLSPQNTVIDDSGILAGAYPPSGFLVTAPFTVPTNTLLSIKLGMAAFSGTGLLSLSVPSPASGSATSTSDFGSTLSFATSGQVFNLPHGFSVNSTEGSISGNLWTGTPVTAQAQAVPEPATIALLGIGLVGLAGGAIRRKLRRKAKP